MLFTSNGRSYEVAIKDKGNLWRGGVIPLCRWRMNLYREAEQVFNAAVREVPDEYNEEDDAG